MTFLIFDKDGRTGDHLVPVIAVVKDVQRVCQTSARRPQLQGQRYRWRSMPYEPGQSPGSQTAQTDCPRKDVETIQQVHALR